VRKINNRLIINRPIEPDSYPDLIVDDGKNGGGVGDWVHLEKHRLLATYIDAARAAAASSSFSNWIYMDPFSGPGRMITKGESSTRPGGAMVAWRQSQLGHKPFSKVFVGDLDEKKLEACEARLAAANCPVTAFHGSAIDTAKKMVAAVPPRSLCLVYIDPYNLALLSHDMIKTFASLPKVDFVVHFSTMDLLRNVDAEMDPERARFDDVLPGWRTRLALHNKSSLPSAFLDDWRASVQGMGFTCSKSMPLIYNNDQHEIYKLVFFAKHDLPMKLWRDVARSPNLDLF
jgi:three-Cys-motif partner protein